jgi:spermidine/putrescine transport system ATP-binding protein
LPDSTPAIELLNATKQYGEVTALDHVSMVIEPGEFFCLLGPSGCGKTTTLNLIGGFIPVTSGELRIEGRKVNDLPPHKRNVNTVFQNYALFPHMTVAQNVAFGLRMEKLSTEEVTRRTGEYLELVGLAGLSGRLPSEMSGGQQQRVALARALAKRPAVLLLDEPLGALDLKLRKNMQAELSRIHRQVGTTFVFVTHDQDEALSMATRIAIMSGGQVAQTGSPREVYDHPVNRFVADFVGETNFLTGTIETEGGRPMFVIPGGERVPAPGASADGPATLMLRPESVAIRAVGEAAADTGIMGRVTNVAFLGNHTRITVTTGAGVIFAVRPHGTGGRTGGPLEEVGKEVCVWWAADDAALIGD